MIWGADRGFASQINRSYRPGVGGHYILLAEKLRHTDTQATAALDRAGRYHQVGDNLRVNEVPVAPGGNGDGDRGVRTERFVGCHNPDQADRDQAVRSHLVAYLETLIDGSDAWTARQRDKLVGSLKGNPGHARRNGRSAHRHHARAQDDPDRARRGRTAALPRVHHHRRADPSLARPPADNPAPRGARKDTPAPGHSNVTPAQRPNRRSHAHQLRKSGQRRAAIRVVTVGAPHLTADSDPANPARSRARRSARGGAAVAARMSAAGPEIVSDPENVLGCGCGRGGARAVPEGCASAAVRS
jgi:hypothetical protein